VRLRSRAITGKSGPKGIEVIVTQLSKTRGLLDIPERYVTLLPIDPEKTFTLEVEVAKSHPFESRCLHCLASVAAITVRNNDTAEIGVSIREINFGPEGRAIKRRKEGLPIV